MSELQQNRMKLAAVLQKEALSKTLSLGSRSTVAFDAGYLYALVALDAPASGEHPSQAVLAEAKQEFGLTGPGIQSALSFLELQYSGTSVGDLLPRLLIWVQEMKMSAEEMWGAQ